VGARHPQTTTPPAKIKNSSATRSRCHTPTRQLDTTYSQLGAGWIRVTETLGERIELICDDLFVTTSSTLQRGIVAAAANSVLVKVNQNGTLKDARDVPNIAHRNDRRTVVSARSAETEDSWLADLAVGWRAGQIRVSSTRRSERTAKWNRLLVEASEQTTFAGPWVQRPTGPTRSGTSKKEPQ